MLTRRLVRGREFLPILTKFPERFNVSLDLYIGVSLREKSCIGLDSVRRVAHGTRGSLLMADDLFPKVLWPL